MATNSQHKSIKEAGAVGLTPAEVLLRLAGSWEDSRSAEEIIVEIKGGREDRQILTTQDEHIL